MTEVAERVEIQEQERPARKLARTPRRTAAVVAALASAYALFVVFRPVPVLEYRMSFLAGALPLVFLCYRWRVRRGAAGQEHEHPNLVNWLLVAMSVAVLVHPLLDFDAFVNRVAEPRSADLVGGMVLTLLLLEAVRRSIGLTMSLICIGFLIYAYLGAYIPFSWEIGHRGFAVDQLVAHLYMGTEGFFGVPLVPGGSR